jgi:hypothetical protein
MLLANFTRRPLGAPQSGQGRPTLLEEWSREAALDSLQRPPSLMDQFQSLTGVAKIWGGWLAWPGLIDLADA